jgi:hypothetical protein
MRLVKRLAVGAFIAAAMSVSAAPAMAAANVPLSGAEASASQAGQSTSTSYGRTGPFATLSECNRAKREWDIDYWVSACYWNDASGWWFEWYSES